MNATDPRSRAIRPGHLRSLALIENTGAYRATRSLYEARLGCDVYLRPTDNGLTVLSLDVTRCASMIGVGARGTDEHRLTALPPSAEHVERACRGYEEKRDRLDRKSEEERYALELLAFAHRGDLRLAESGAFFVHQEWRIDGTKLDLLAVDLDSRRLMVIELKASEDEARRVDVNKGGDARAQAERYASALFRERETVYPYFERLARAMAKAHGAPEALASIELARDERPIARIGWPKAR